MSWIVDGIRAIHCSSNFNFLCVLYFAKVLYNTKSIYRTRARSHTQTGHKSCFVSRSLYFIEREYFILMLLKMWILCLVCVWQFAVSIYFGSWKMRNRPVGKSSVSQSWFINMDECDDIIVLPISYISSNISSSNGNCGSSTTPYHSHSPHSLQA